MSKIDMSLQEAREQADGARVELRTAITDALEWFSPDRLKAEAAHVASHQIGEVKTAIRRSVTRHPLIAWPAFVAIGAILVFLLRRPTAALAHAGAQAVTALRRHIPGRK